MANKGRAIPAVGFIILAALWAGLVIGVSFIATPIKFSAPTLDLPAAIDVGRVTFAFLNKVEWGLAVVMVLLVFTASVHRLARAMGIAVVAIVLVQSLWLLPVLEARSIAFIDGTPMDPSIHHGVFGAAEILKIVLLCLMAIFAAKGPAPDSSKS